jgi:outer membrane lipoprotein-sorting protein
MMVVIRMKKIIVKTLTVLYFSSVYYLVADEITVNEILNKMQEYENKINILEISFKQNIEFVNVGEKYETECRLVYEKPKKLYYEQNKPQKIQIISNGNNLFLYNPSYKQVFVENWKSWKGIDYFIPGLFTHEGNTKYLKKYFNIKFDKKEDNFYVLYITPKKKYEKSKYLDGKYQFYLWIDEKEYYPKKFKFQSETVISTTEILDWQINTAIDEKIFQFTIPEDVEVLRLNK